MTDAARGRAARPRPDAPLRRRDVGDRVGAHRRPPPGSPSSGPAAPGAPRPSPCTGRTTRSSCSTGCYPAPTTPTPCASTTCRSGRGPGCRRAGSARSTRTASRTSPSAPAAPPARTTRRATRRTGSTRCAPSPLALRDDPEVRWPDVLLLLGDQVYADTTPHAELEEFMAARRSLDEPPGLEIKDFVEYAELYRLAWSERGHPLGAVDRAVGDDLRRPRHPRRLEHLVVVAPRDPHDDVVAGAHRLRARRPTGCTSTWATSRRPSWPRRRSGARVVEHAASGATDELDLTAQRRRARGPGRRRARRRTGGATRARWATAPWSSSTRAPPASCGRTGARCSTPTSCAGSTACCRAGCGTCSSAPRCPSSCPRACTTSRRWTRPLAQGAYGRTVAAGRREAAPQHRPRALGRLQRGFRRAVRAGHAGGPRRARPGAADDHLPLRRRAQLLPRRGHRPACGWARSPGCCRRCARRSATRCRGACGWSCRCSPSRWCGRCGSSRRARRDVPDPGLPLDGHRRAVVRQQHRAGHRGAGRPRAHLGRPASSRTTRPAAAAAGVCRAPRPAARRRSGSASGSVQG